ncbi:MAG: hypothetical protein IT372_27355 [Polyangiaceae bacterium]|nr:hypothetical protein [Polyangiaceae bacterium]
MAIPSNPAPEFCAACGFPLRGPRCDACGVDRTPSVGRRAGYAADLDGYDGDIDAWRTRDPVRFVGYCVGAEAGVSVQPTSSGDGVGWIFPLRSVTLFVGLDAAVERLAIDAPLVRVPERQRVPVLRASLELCDAATPARLCLRDDLLLLRRVARVSAVTPAALRQALRSSAEQAERLVETLTSWFDARPAFSEEQRGSLTWAAAGRARPLKSFSIPPAPPRSLPPGPPSLRSAALPPLPMAPLPMPPAPPMPSRLGPEPAWATPAPAASAPNPEHTFGAPGRAPHGAPSAPNLESSRAQAQVRDAESIPDILSPLLAAPAEPPSSRPAPMSPQDAPPARPPGVPAKLDSSAGRAGAVAAPPRPDGAAPRPGPSPEAERRNAPTVPFRRSTPHMDAIAPPPVSSPPMSTPPVSVRPPAMPELDAEQLARQSASARADQARSPADRFCQLLRDAQALATALSFQDRASVMVILIRSTVFRAILEHGDALPSAVAHLYRSTLAATRDLGQAEGAHRRPNPVSIAEPALLVLERIVSARGQVPEEKPLQIDPLTSAAHAREHLSGYLREIERAPAEPALRHFLALGALSELLVRAKLPAKTDQRLREIVAYAHRDGPRHQAIELMMTALKKIVAQ